jgi:outer membrane protein assembly factor BamB
MKFGISTGFRLLLKIQWEEHVACTEPSKLTISTWDGKSQSTNSEIAAFRREIELYVDCLTFDDGTNMLSRNVGSQFGQGY